MSWNNFLGSREALTYGSDMFKQTVIRYFQLQRYKLVTSSSQEGHFPDIVMEDDKGKRIWVECKSEKISIFEKRMKAEILKYFSYWLRIKNDEKVKFVIFSEGITRHEDTREVLTLDAIKTKTISWFKDRDNLPINEEIEQRLKQAKDDEIIEYFHGTDVNFCTGYELDVIIQDRLREMKWEPSDQSKLLLKETIERRKPRNERSIVMTNFMKLKYPAEFYEIESKYKLKTTIHEKVKEDKILGRLPAFIIPRFEKGDPVIRSFDEKLDKLRNYTRGEVFIRKTDRLDKIRKLQFLNSQLNRWLWCKGLRRVKDMYYFPYKDINVINPKSNEDLSIKIENRARPKTVTRVIVDEKTEKIKYVEHRTLRIELGYHGSDLGIYIWPTWIFTSDGIEEVDSDFRKNLHYKYRKSHYNYNKSKRTEVIFWKDFLLKGEFVLETDNWFDEFGFDDIKEIEIDWTSKTPEEDDYEIDFNEEYDIDIEVSEGEELNMDIDEEEILRQLSLDDFF